MIAHRLSVENSAFTQHQPSTRRRVMTAATHLRREAKQNRSRNNRPGNGEETQASARQTRAATDCQTSTDHNSQHGGEIDRKPCANGNWQPLHSSPHTARRASISARRSEIGSRKTPRQSDELHSATTATQTAYRGKARRRQPLYSIVTAATGTAASDARRHKTDQTTQPITGHRLATPAAQDRLRRQYHRVA